MNTTITNTLRAFSAACLIGAAITGLSAPVFAQDQTAEAPAPDAQATQWIQAGSLVCKGDGGWGAIIVSKKAFKCIFTAPNG